MNCWSFQWVGESQGRAQWYQGRALLVEVLIFEILCCLYQGCALLVKAFFYCLYQGQDSTKFYAIKTIENEFSFFVLCGAFLGPIDELDEKKCWFSAFLCWFWESGADLLPVISEHARVGARPHLFTVSLHQDHLAIMLSWAKSFMEMF